MLQTIAMSKKGHKGLSKHQIDRVWRRYDLKNDPNSALMPTDVPNLNFDSSAPTPPPIPTPGNGSLVKRAPKSRFQSPSRMYSSSSVTQRFKNNIKSNNVLSTNSQVKDAYKTYYNMNKGYKIDDFCNDLDMHRNLDIAAKGKFDLDVSGNRRMATKFAVLLSKIAEDMTGEPEPGDEFWDVERLLNRRLSRENILNCKMSREKESIIMILDSSPSCSRQARFYSQLASIAALHSDVELYNAPNARLVEIYNRRKRKFVKCITPQDIMADVHEWSLFRNRVIIFFGDGDGQNILEKAADHNKIYWFNYEDNYFYDSFCRKLRITYFGDIYSNSDFINAMKTIR